MGSEDTAYMARVNVAVWLIRKAGKIARRLNGITPDQRQAVEDEIVAIGRRMYDEMRQVVEDEIAAVGQEMYGDTQQQPRPETTHDHHARAKSRYEFGDESERDAYVAGVVDQIAEATHDPGGDHKQEAYAAAVRVMVPNAGPELIAHFKSKGFSSEQAADSFVRLFSPLERNAESND